MDVKTAIEERRSIRKFGPDKVSQNTIREILEEARWAPSWGNTQAWEFLVVTGDTLKKYQRANCEKMLKGEAISPEIPMPEEWPGNLNKRYTDTVARLSNALTIAREDKEARNELYEKIFSLFDAPCLIVACFDKSLCTDYAMLDIGLVIQTICLSAHEKGLGTCIMAAAVMYPGLLRELVTVPDNKVIAMGIALGYPDLESRENNFERVRADLDELVTWAS